MIPLIIVVLAGLAIRVDYAANRVEGQPEDSQKYYDISEELYRSGDYGPPELDRRDTYHPGSPLFYAGLYYATGGVHPLLGRLLVALMGAAAILLVYLLARRLGGPWIGLAGAALIAIHPSAIEYTRTVMGEPIALFTLTAAVLAFLWADERRGRWEWALPGALLGITCLFRPEYLVFGLVLALIAALRTRRAASWGASAAAAAVLLVAFALPIAPWTIRNYVVLDRFVPVSTGGGSAVFIGTYLPGSGDHFETFNEHRQDLVNEIPGLTPAERRELSSGVVLGDILDELAARRHPDLNTDAALTRLGRRNFSDYFGDDPLAYTGMLFEKTWHMWNRGGGMFAPQRPWWVGYHRALVILALIGLGALAWWRRWELFVYGSLLLGVTALAALLLAPPRRNVPLLGLVAVMAAYGGASILRALTARRARVIQ